MYSSPFSGSVAIAVIAATVVHWTCRCIAVTAASFSVSYFVRQVIPPFGPCSVLSPFFSALRVSWYPASLTGTLACCSINGLKNNPVIAIPLERCSCRFRLTFTTALLSEYIPVLWSTVGSVSPGLVPGTPSYMPTAYRSYLRMLS